MLFVVVFFFILIYDQWAAGGKDMNLKHVNWEVKTEKLEKLKISYNCIVKHDV